MLNGYTRSPEHIKKILVKNSSGIYSAGEDLSIYIPTRYEDKGMIRFGEENYIVGVFGLFSGSHYSVSKIVGMVNIGSPKLTKVIIDEIEYYKADFTKGQVVIKRDKIITSNKIPFRLFNDIISRGYVPFYLNYDDIGTLLNTGKKYSAVGFCDKVDVFETITSLIARESSMSEKFYRQSVKGYDDLSKQPPQMNALYNVNYSASNTLSKITGSYFTDGVTSALINSTKKVERIESILRA